MISIFLLVLSFGILLLFKNMKFWKRITIAIIIFLLLHVGAAIIISEIGDRARGEIVDFNNL